MAKSWRLEDFDTFEGESYHLEGEYETEETARIAAKKRLEKIEEEQPSSMSGGQSFGGIQDRVFIVRPDGTKYRFNG